MRHKITLLIIATIILNVVCCKPDCKEGGTRYAEDLYKPYFAALFPYAVKQDIRFLKNGTDTILFYNQGYESGYNYTFTQEDCPQKVPLEFKKLLFYDSLEGNTFYLYNYKNESFYSKFTVNINNKNIYDGGVGDIIILSTPYNSVKIGQNQYDTLSYIINNDGDYFYYKTYKTGMIKFKINNDVFELIP
jgi:hypothetical protein